ncbi:MAG TPA: hypothetical protein VGP47_07165 [Parachlamydiaceae bacterium]|nr:hypothetical protein [Parachlamydiaceae bacterium]
MSIISHFKEFYLGNTLEANEPTCSLPENFEQLVDLENEAHKYSFRPSEKSVVDVLDKLDKESHKALTSWQYNSVLYERGFKVLSNGWGKVYEHPDLDGWLIKACDSSRKSSFVDGDGGQCNSLQFNNLHRVIMAEKMREEIAIHHWNIDIPEKRLYRCNHAADSESLHTKYYVLSKKIDILSPEETIEEISFHTIREQRRIAKQICDLIKRTGFTDAHSGNIVALKNNSGELKLAIIDTEPIGLMKDISDTSKDSPRNFKCCVLTGLSKLASSFGGKLSAFQEEIKYAQEELAPGGIEKVRQKRMAAMKKNRILFVVKLIASIAMPIIPLIVLGISASATCFGGVGSTFDENERLRQQYNIDRFKYQQ